MHFVPTLPESARQIADMQFSATQRIGRTYLQDTQSPHTKTTITPRRMDEKGRGYLRPQSRLCARRKNADYVEYGGSTPLSTA